MLDIYARSLLEATGLRALKRWTRAPSAVWPGSGTGKNRQPASGGAGPIGCKARKVALPACRPDLRHLTSTVCTKQSPALTPDLFFWKHSRSRDQRAASVSW